MGTKSSSIEREVNLIDIEKAFIDKNPTLYKFLPKFILNKLKRLIHQDEINEIILANSGKKGIEFSTDSLNQMGVKTCSLGFENIPKKGGVIVAANHPLGGLDGVAIIKEVGKIRQDIHVLVNDILLQIKNFEPIFVPINKIGKNPRLYLKHVDDLYASNKCIILFPAGMVSRRQEQKKISDLQWQKSFITKAIKHKRNIVPVFISGKNTKRFYNIAYWRKKIGIKSNIEMLFLADEMFKQKGNTIMFKFGKAIPWKTFTNSNNLIWAQKIKKHVYLLEKDHTVLFDENS